MLRSAALAAVCAANVAAVSANPIEAATLRPVSVEDLARFGAVGDPLDLGWNEMPVAPALFSPNGERVALLVRRGNVEKLTNDGSLLVYSRSQLLSGGEPEEVASFSSATNFQPISFMRWLEDGETLVFAGTEGEEQTQVRSINVRTRELRTLTAAVKPMLWFDVTPDGRHVTLLTQRPYTAIWEQEGCRKVGCRVTSMRLGDTEWGLDPGPSPLTVYDLNIRQSKVIKLNETLARQVQVCDDELVGGMSPDGRFALRRCELQKPPEWWREYTEPVLSKCLRTHNPNCAMSFVLIDLVSGETFNLSDAPAVAKWNQPVSLIWVDGGKRFILSGSFETLEGVDSAERLRRVGSLSALLVDPGTRSLQRIARLDGAVKVTDARWDLRRKILSLATENVSRKPLPIRSFKRTGQGWIKSSVDVKVGSDVDPQGRIGLSIKQTLNDRPILMVTDKRAGANRQLLDPNPWLRERALGRVEAISWTLNDGTQWKGGLYFPPDYVEGRRYPVVLQTHGFEPDQFSMTGVSREFAARALTAHGIVVLQVSENVRGVDDSPQELERAQAGYEAAVTYLDGRGIADKARIGIQGWSRTGTLMGYALTHSSMSFAAGVFGDTADMGWHYYVMVGAPINLDALYGASPFGPGISEWIKRTPTFNLHRVTTPMLMLASGTGAGLWDWYAGLRRLEKPVEQWVFPDGVHETYQLTQRLRHNHLLVDWFRFWLTDEERAEPAASNKETREMLADQYTRWRAMRSL